MSRIPEQELADLEEQLTRKQAQLKAILVLLSAVKQQRDELLDTLRGVYWKFTTYGTHWDVSQAERDAIFAAIKKAEGSARP